MDCGIATVGGNPASGGGASAPPRTLFAVDPDIDSTSVFPVITTMVSAAIPANTLRSNGDMLRFQFEGNVLNAGAVGATFAPFLGIDAVFMWGAVSSLIPNTGVLFSWHCFGLITRKSALTYTAGGLFFCNNVTTALTGIGSLALANQGGPFSAPDANPACNWGNAQNFIFNMSATIAGTRWRIKGGSIDPPLYRP